MGLRIAITHHMHWHWAAIIIQIPLVFVKIIRDVGYLPHVRFQKDEISHLIFLSLYLLVFFAPLICICISALNLNWQTIIQLASSLNCSRFLNLLKTLNRVQLLRSTASFISLSESIKYHPDQLVRCEVHFKSFLPQCKTRAWTPVKTF